MQSSTNDTHVNDSRGGATQPGRASKSRAAVKRPTKTLSLGKEATSQKVAKPKRNAAAPSATSMIATAAYYLAERRHFEPGHELEDWLAAESQIKASMNS